MASAAGQDGDSRAPTRALFSERMADKQRTITVLAGGAFVVGVAGATVYGLRKARIQALKEAQELAAEAASSSSSISAVASSSRLPSAAATPSVLRRKQVQQLTAPAAERTEDLPPQSVLSLFKQMNASIFNPRKVAQTTSNASRSVFDDGDPANTALPSVLRKKQPVSTRSASSTPVLASPILATSYADTPIVQASGTSAIRSSKIDYSEMDSTLDFLGLSAPIPLEEQARMQKYEAENASGPTSFGQSPVGLTIKAFLIATGAVAAGAFATVEITKWALGVENMDQFVVAMSGIIPGRRAIESRLGDAAPHMKTKREDDELDSHTFATRARPKSIDEALDDLGNAESFTDFVQKLKTQLDAERDEEVRRRFSTIKSASNDSLSSSYPIHSVDESTSGYRPHGSPGPQFAKISPWISPVLPTSAFAVGMVSGFLSAGKRAGVVFMAENAHRLPETVQGWFFYTKTKNYKVMLGAIKGGLKQGTRLGLWVTGFCLTERSAELGRRLILREFTADSDQTAKVAGHWVDGALAGVGTATVAALLYQLPRPATIRIVQLGLAAGALTGGIRDAQEHLLHRPIGGVAKHT